MFWKKKDRDSASTVDTYLREVNGPPAPATGPPAVAPPSDFGPPVAATPPRAVPGAFSLVVEDAFTITGRGTVVTGTLADGVARTGQQVAIIRDGVHVVSSEVTGVESARRLRREAGPGDRVGLLMEGLGKDQVQRGDIVAGR
ncbi:EF-Tu/IF-2/RF-3 family GTPase [Occultella aeris]|uniref:Elongation factor Tu n=1 Tax=Occultella aeris TaxID=2761496 RepID=A0A7M4DD86_9MICO|nr:EF-Tu/IF-2/RF-3 family GTPase [Occultella aeris]VZO34805.1 Elongation factor Tu [Occultella aeris]